MSDANNRRWANPKGVVLCVAALGFVSFFALTLQRSISWYDEWSRANLLRQAERVADAIPYPDLRMLTGTAADLDSPFYARLKHQLVAARSLEKGWAWVCLIGLRDDGKAFFYLDSGQKPTGAPVVPGQAYEDASPLLRGVFSRKAGCVEGPARTRGGEWVSPFVPICDPRTGDVIAVLGVGVPAATWRQEMVHARRFPTVVAMLAGTILLVWSALQGFRPTRRCRSSCLDVMGVLSLGIVATVGVVRFAWLHEALHERDEFGETMATRVAPVVEEFHDLQDEDLVALRALFQGSLNVTNAEFESFVGRAVSNACVRRWAWVSPVPAAIARPLPGGGRGMPGTLTGMWELDGAGRRVPVGERDVYYPVRYAYPPEGQRGLVGYDLGSVGTRRQALEQAIRSGLATATVPIELIDHRVPGLGFLVACSLAADAVRDDGKAHLPGTNGLVIAVVGEDDLLRLVRSVAAQLADGTVVMADLVQLGEPGEPAVPIVSTRAKGQPAWNECRELVAQYPVFAFGRTYVLRTYAADRFGQGFTWAVWMHFGAALIAALAITALVAFLQRRKEWLESVVAERTEELRRGLDRFNESGVHSRTYSWETDAQGLYTYMSRSACHVLGYAPRELVGRLHYYDIHPPEGRQLFIERTQAVFRAKGSFSGLENPILTKSGRVVWVSTNGVPNLGEDGDLLGYRGTDREVTEQRETRLNNEFQLAFQRLLADVSRSFIAAGEDGFDAAVDRSLQRLGELFEVDRAYVFAIADDREHVTNTHEWCSAGIEPQIGELQSVSTGTYPWWTAQLDTRQCVHIPVVADLPPEAAAEKELLTGQQVLSLVCIPMRNSKGNLNGFLGMDSVSRERRWPEDQIALLQVLAEILANATARRDARCALLRSRERYRLLTEGMRDVVWVLDAETLCYIYVSPPAERLLGYSVHELMSMSFAQLMHQGEAARLKGLVRERVAELRAGEAQFGTYYTHEIEHIRKDGSTVWTEVVACYWYDHETGRIELHGVTRDVSERKRAESEKDHLQKQLVQAQKMESVGRLAGGVAHDFNNMLQGILGYAEMALDQVDPGDRLHGDIKEIQKVAERSADLTKQLLAFARRQTVVPRVVDLNEVVSEVLSMLRRLIGEEIRLAWHPHEGLWPVKLDPSQIGMALANLCVNSRDAISGPGRITIESHNVAVDEVYCTSHPDAFVGDYAMVSVSDTGCGIAREVLPQVFDPFFTTKDVDKGTGLGLATVHGIVLQNEGFVNAYSEVGRGTTFRIYFPRHLEPVPEPVAAAPRAQVPGGTETVLVVEDEPSLLRMCGEVLRRLGYDVLLASHPEMALALAEGPGQRIDLLMTDVVMPDMNGRELATRLAVGHPGLSCLYMSGYPESAISHHGIVEEGLEFIPKPFSRRALADKVRKILDERGMGG